MKTYYRALPQNVVGPASSHHEAEFRDAFDWVLDIKEASWGSLGMVEARQRNLRQNLLETTLVEVKDERLMIPMYVICLGE
jgi:hypothetical protein